MKKVLTLFHFIGFLFLLKIQGFSQTYLHNTTAETTCSGTYYDAGGPNGNYGDQNGGTVTKTFTSSNGNRLKFNFTQFITEGVGRDYLYVYDGPNNSFPIIGLYQGNLAPFSVESSGTSITFGFTSSFATTFAGWTATIECTTAPLPVYNMASGTTSTCSGLFYDNGGANQSYPNFENRTQTFCSSNGQKLVAVFSPDNTSIGLGDTLWAYDGNSVSSPLLGAFTGGSIIETLTSSGTCLTFRFKSDGVNPGNGWSANLGCTNATPSSTTYLISAGIRGTCDGIFTDDGGTNGNYANLSNGTKTQTFTSYNGNRLKINFQQFQTWDGNDVLTIHDGPNSSFPVIGQYFGTLAPFSVEGTGSSLTFAFRSSFNDVAAGWRGTFECTTPILPVYKMSSGSTNTCSGVFYDNGGPSQTYPSFENRTQTFCSNNGQRIVANFNALVTSISSGDTLWAFDGSGVSSPLLGIYVFGSTIETLTSTGTCLTFRFKSDGVGQGNGWQAQLNCTNTQPATTTYLISAGTRGTCDGIFTDDGGPNGNYANLSNGTKTQTFISYNGNRLKINFQQFKTWDGNDVLTIYDGPNSSFPVIGQYFGTLAPFSVEGTGSSLTFAFRSSFNDVAAGWRGTFECTTPVLPVYNMSSGTVNACSGMFYDADGANGNYPNFENRTQTFCSNNGQKIQFQFNPLAFGLSNNDSLWVFDGNSVSGNPLGVFVNGSRVETLTSSGTCLTYRFKSNSSSAIGWAAQFQCVSSPPSQIVYQLSSGVRYVCSGIFTDDGGITGNYTNMGNGSKTQTFGSYNGDRLKISFQQFQTWDGNDVLRVFDGPSTSSPLIGIYFGTRSPFSIESSGRFLTFQFTSSFNDVSAGWQGFFECTTPTLPTYNMSNGTVNTCSGMFYDAGGSQANYPQFENRTQTFCSDNGQKVQFNFNMQAFALGSDSLWAYDGNSTNSPLLGIYINNSNVETITSSGTCMTFRFKSSANVPQTGWQASLSCVHAPPPNLVYPISSGVRVICSGVFTDNGGLNGNYTDNTFREQTFQSANNERLSFVFNAFSMENNDILEAYDGPNTNFPRIALLTGSTPGGTTITSTGTTITFRFQSNFSSNSAGWVANIACSGPALAAYNMSSGTVNTCSGVFYDSNGGGQAYDNNENRTQTFCSDNGQKMVLDFTNFSLEGNDSLWVFDGNSTSAPLLGLFLNSFIPEKLTSSGTCLTFRFRSNATSEFAGWKALISCSNVPPAQVVYPINSGIRAVCSGLFTDDGGLANNYSNSQNRIYTLQGYNNQRIRLNFQQFQLENGFDFLRIYDGPNVLSPSLGTFTGSGGPGIITSSGNSLTFWFTSNSNTTGNWAASIECAGPPLTPYNMSSGTVNTCSGVFYDAGGVGSRYPANEFRTQTFCSDNGQKIRFDFNNQGFDLLGDSLFVYDGNSTNSPLIGIYVPGSFVEPLISSGTCLTFRFKSDNTASEGTGWGAIISCISASPGLTTYPMSTGLRIVCDGVFTDNGGANAGYGNGLNQIQTFRSPNNNRLRFDFSQFSTESGLDYLDIYDGPTTAYPYLGRFSGSSSPGEILSSGNSLTFRFVSNGSTNNTGWLANISCAGPALTPYNMSNGTITACEGMFYDDGGVLGNYSNNQNLIQTFCSGNGNRMVFRFNQNSITQFNDDSLFVYDGNSVSSPLVAVYTGATIYEPAVSTGTCITFRFKSSSFNSSGGWAANFSCLDVPPQPEVFTMRGGIRYACSGIFSDDGGLNESYRSNQNPTYTFFSNTPGARLQFNFSQFSTEFNSDRLQIYDGPSTSTSLLGTYSGSNSPGIVTSTGNALTFRWLSNGSVSSSGWAASIACVASVPLVGTLSGTPFCTGASIQIPFTSPTQTAGNVYTAQLSDANGTFTNPTSIGTLTGTTSGSISAVLPTGLGAGNNYRIRILASNPATSGNPSSPFSILTAPAQPGNIFGSSNLCAGSQNVTYSIASVPNSTSYTWTVPSGATLVSGQGTTSIVVNFGVSSGNVSVTPVNSCGNGPVRDQAITVNSASAITVSTSNNSTGNQVCAGGSVNFSSTISAGSNPLYQWILNGIDFPEATGPGFSLANVQSNATVSLRVTGTTGCFNPTSATSQGTTITVIPTLTPSANISSSVPNNSTCSGQTVNFSASLQNQGSSPGYQWRINGVNATNGTNSTFSSSNLQNGDQVSLNLTSSATCASPTLISSNSLTMIVNQTVTPSVSISSNTGGNQVCAGNTLILNANITNGGDSPQYQWFQNGNIINGETNASYTIPSGLTGSQNFTVRLTSNAICATQTQVTSSVFTVTGVSSVTPSVSVSSNISSGPICVGTSITFTANPINGGSTPGYVWRINGNPVSGQTGSTFTTSTLANNDQVSVVLTSNDPCASPASATSSGTIVNLVTSITPSVTATSSIPGNSICAGTEITFTANPTNGGSNPGYVWRINGNPVSGQTGATFATSSLTNGQTVSVALTSSFTCASPATASSAPISVTVNPIVTPSVSVASSQGNSICQNSSTTLTANPTNGGSSPGYQWFLNGNSLIGQTGATLVTPTTLTGTANYTVQLSSNANCANPTQVSSQNFALTLTPNTLPSVAFTSSVPGNTICNGQSITFTATPTNGGSSPQYQWMVNGNDVSGQTSATFTSTSIPNNAEISVRMTSNAVCPLPATVTSLVQAVTVTPNSPASVSAVSNVTGNSPCNGQLVTFTANPVNGGTTPSYQWILNGNNVIGQTGATFQTSILANNDQVSVRMTSNSSCASPATATSTPLVMSILPTLVPSVSLSSQPVGTSFCAGTVVQFTANPVNGGSSPGYSWQVNGNSIPNATGSTFSLTLNSASTVTATLTSNAACANPGSATSSGVVLSVTPSPQVIAQNDTAVCEATGSFTLAASPAGGVWAGTGVSSAGVFAPGNIGTFRAFYSYTSPVTGCTGMDSVLINVLARPSITFPVQAPICATAPPRQLTANPTGGTWSGTGVNSTGLFNPSTSGPGQQALTYTVLQNGCQATRVLVVNVTAPPTVDVGGAESVCFSTNEVQLTGIPAGGTWSGNGVNASGLFTPGFVTPGTNVTLTYTVTVDGCTASGTKQMSVSLNPLAVNAGTDQTVCISDPAFVLTGLTGSGGTWTGTGVSSNGVFNPSTAGVGNFTLTYTVTFLQSPTCSGSDTKNITVIPSPQAPTVQGDTICRQGVGTLTATGVAAVYRWYTTQTGGSPITGQISPIYTTPLLNATTTYFVSQVAGTCESPRAPVLAFVNNFNNASFIPSGAPIVLTAAPSNGQAYQWLLAGNPISGATQNTFQPTQNGDYSVIIRLDGCADTSATQFVLVTSAEGLTAQNALKVFPNPTSRELLIEGRGIMEIKLIDALGKTLIMEKLGVENSHKLDLSSVPFGFYMLEIKSMEGVKRVKVLKK